LIRSAGVADTDRVVDVGCGTGQPAARLAEVIGAQRVSGIDPNEAVIAVARKRVPGADIRLGSAEALPFADQSFDAALAQLVVNLVGDSPLAVREMARVTKSSGVVGHSGSLYLRLDPSSRRAFARPHMSDSARRGGRSG
jgi:ubiquinone/menaquinone biosynthesis C-methylase UbiE